MRPLTAEDLGWLETRIGRHRWTDEDRRRLLADLRDARRLADTLQRAYHRGCRCGDGVRDPRCLKLNGREGRENGHPEA